MNLSGEPSTAQDALRVAPGQASITAQIAPGPQQLSGTIIAQPSKNYTSRYLLAAALAGGHSTVHNIAASEDSIAMQRGLSAIGARIATVGTEAADVAVDGVDGKPVLSGEKTINVGNAGAVLRLLLSIGALLPEAHFVTDRPDSLGRRPNADLLNALHEIGCLSESGAGLLPITLYGGKLHGGRINVSGAHSSQYLSGILFLAPLLPEPVEIVVTNGLVSRAPVRQTMEVLAAAGIRVDASDDLMQFRITPQRYRPGVFHVNGDWPGSAAVLAAAAVTDSTITVSGLCNDHQGEKAAADVLRNMGAAVDISRGDAVHITGGPLHGVEFDGDLATDAVLALMGAAALAEGRTRFYNVSNLRIKECDRITEPIEELRRIGVRCWEGREVGDSDPDAVIIEGNPDGYKGGIDVDGRKDHRVIMMLSIVGLRCRQGLRIRGAEHVAKSYPDYFAHLSALGANVHFQDGGVD